MKILRPFSLPLAISVQICYTWSMKKENGTIFTSDTPEVIAPEIPQNNTDLPVRTVSNDNSARPGTRYKFRFSTLTRIVLIAGLALCLAAIALTTWQLSDFLRAGNLSVALEWLKFALLYFVSGALAVLLVAALVRSEYVLTNRTLTLALGFVRTKYAVSAIVSVHHFKGANKLVVYFEDEKNKYLAIVIRESLYETFIKDLLSRNERIAFSFSTAEEEEEFKKKK